jgi:hypothetical protein
MNGAPIFVVRGKNGKGWVGPPDFTSVDCFTAGRVPTQMCRLWCQVADET